MSEPAETATVPRADFAVLVALAFAGAAAFADSDAAELPPGVTIEQAVTILERYVDQ